MSKPKTLLTISAFFLAAAVALGAFGAHALEDVLTPERMETWKTAVSYHFWNSLGLMGIALTSKIFDTDFKWSTILILTGLIIFPGTLYLLCLTGISWLGAITPIGGVAFILGWVIFGVNIIKMK